MKAVNKLKRLSSMRNVVGILVGVTLGGCVTTTPRAERGKGTWLGSLALEGSPSDPICRYNSNFCYDRNRLSPRLGALLQAQCSVVDDGGREVYRGDCAGQTDWKQLRLSVGRYTVGVEARCQPTSATTVTLTDAQEWTGVHGTIGLAQPREMYLVADANGPAVALNSKVRVLRDWPSSSGECTKALAEVIDAGQGVASGTVVLLDLSALGATPATAASPVKAPEAEASDKLTQAKQAAAAKQFAEARAALNDCIALVPAHAECTALAKDVDRLEVTSAQADVATAISARDYGAAGQAVVRCLAVDPNNAECQKLKAKIEGPQIKALVKQTNAALAKRDLTVARSSVQDCLALSAKAPECVKLDARVTAAEEAAEKKSRETAMEIARTTFITVWNQEIAKKGLPGEAVASGPKNTVITIYWPNMTVPMMEELERQGILDPRNMKGGGFKTLVIRPRAFADKAGRRESWTFNLSKF